MAAGYAALFGLAGAALLVAGYVAFARARVGGDRSALLVRLQDLAAVCDAGGVDAVRANVRSWKAAGRPPFAVRIASRDGARVFADTPPDFEELELGALDALPADGAVRAAPLPGDEGIEMSETAAVRLRGGGRLAVARNVQSRETMLERTRALAGWALAPVLLGAALGGAFLAGRQSRRFVLAMRDALDAVAHDLRTPVARLRASAELALEPATPIEASRAAIADCLEESDRLLSQLDTLMDLSEAEVGAIRLDRRAVDLTVALEQAADLYRMVAEDKGVALGISCPAGTVIEADPGRLRQALANLLDNAVKFTPTGGRVSLVAVSVDGGVRCSVTDSGPGIPAAELPRIWERLFRGEAGRGTRGLGLGLALVKAIAEAHGGRVGASSPPRGGATVWIELPA